MFASGLLIGVLVIDTPGFGHGRLTAIPSYRILAEADVHAILTAHEVDNELESVELADLLISPGKENHIRLRRGDRTSPAMLLRADYEVVRFYGRTEQLTDLTRWCADPGEEVGIRLLVGPGGRGKTRLARQLATDLRGRPVPGRDAGRCWVTGFLADTVTSSQLARLADTAAPVLLVVDYAETRTAQLAELLRLLWTANSAPVRLLLLARATGDWWQQLSGSLGSPLGRPISLGSMSDTEDERDRAFRSAVTDFSAYLPGITGHPAANWSTLASTTRPPADLGNPRYGNPLTLHLAALLSLLDQAESAPAAAAGRDEWTDNPEQYLLTHHEKRYWSATVPTWLDLGPDTLAESVTVPTLVGAVNRAEALSVLRAIPSLQGQAENSVIAVANWLRDLYPTSVGQFWGSLQPDRVGEHLIAETLTRDSQLLAAVLPAATEGQTYQAVTVLGRALANSTIAAVSRDRMASALTELFSTSNVGGRLANITLQVATETADPVPLLDALKVVLSKLPDDRLQELDAHLPVFSLALARLAADVAVVLVDRSRQVGDRGENARSQLAMSLNNLSMRLADLGRREDALIAVEEAVHLRRLLAEGRPDVFIPSLSVSLHDLAVSLIHLGRREDALTAIKETVRLDRRLAAEHPNDYTPDLAVSLNTLGAILTDLGRREDALTVIEETVNLHRRLCAEGSDTYTPMLAASLTNLGNEYFTCAAWGTPCLPCGRLRLFTGTWQRIARTPLPRTLRCR